MGASLAAAVLVGGSAINTSYVEREFQELSAICFPELQEKSVDELQSVRGITERYAKNPKAIDAVVKYKLEEIDYVVMAKHGLASSNLLRAVSATEAAVMARLLVDVPDCSH